MEGKKKKETKRIWKKPKENGRRNQMNMEACAECIILQKL